MLAASAVTTLLFDTPFSLAYVVTTPFSFAAGRNHARFTILLSYFLTSAPSTVLITSILKCELA